MAIHTIKASRNKPEHRVESLGRSLFQAMLHFCRAPFRGVLRPRAAGKSAVTLVFRGRSLRMSMFRRARMNHIRCGSRLIKRLSGVPPLFAILGRVREFPIAQPGSNAVSATSVPAPLSRTRRRPWQATRAAGPTGPNAIALTVRDAKKARPADYPDLPETSRNRAELAKERTNLGCASRRDGAWPKG
jgi:hypothetical protein